MCIKKVLKSIDLRTLSIKNLTYIIYWHRLRVIYRDTNASQKDFEPMSREPIYTDGRTQWQFICR